MQALTDNLETSLLGSAQYWINKSLDCNNSLVFTPEILEGDQYLSSKDCLSRSLYFYQELAYCFPRKTSYKTKAKELIAIIN